MNKLIAEYLAAHNLTYEKKSGFYGTMNGYEVNGNFTAFGSNYDMTFFGGGALGAAAGNRAGAYKRGSCFLSVEVNLKPDQITRVQNWLIANKKEFAIFGFSVTERGAECTLAGSAKKFLLCLDGIVPFLQSIGAPQGSCPFCGEKLDSGARPVGIGGKRMHAHEKCFDEFAKGVQIDENIAAAAPDRTGRGILGAILGALVGSVVWAAFYYFGFIAFVAAFLISIGAAFGWGKLGGKNNMKKIVTVWIVSLAALTLTMVVSYCIDIDVVMKSEGVSGSAFDMFLYLLEEYPEYKAAILYDTAISYVFAVIANIAMTVSVARSQKKASGGLVKY